LEFIEPDEEGNLISLELDYDKAELEQLKKLVAAIWKHVLELDFPDISKYPPTMAGIRQFENDYIYELKNKKLFAVNVCVLTIFLLCSRRFRAGAFLAVVFLVVREAARVVLADCCASVSANAQRPQTKAGFYGSKQQVVQIYTQHTANERSKNVNRTPAAKTKRKRRVK
jgi:hypothetical protein